MTTNTEKPSVNEVLYAFLNDERTIEQIASYLDTRGMSVADVPRAIRRMRAAGYSLRVTRVLGSKPRAYTYYAY